MFMLLAALLMVMPQEVLPEVREIVLVPDYETAETVVLEMPRDQWIDFEVVLLAPSVETEVESLEMKADNQHPDYWRDRMGPNIFVDVQRLTPTGDRRPVRVRIVSSGGGKSLREHRISVGLALLASDEARRARVRAFLQSAAPSLDHARVDAAVAYFEHNYIGHPPGEYEVMVTYEPQTGFFAGKAMGRRIVLTVSDGPDMLDRMLNPTLMTKQN